MTVDIYDDLEHLVPAERRDAFLRLSRQIKEYGDHNPELLRLVEVMGFLSLYTNDLPKRIAGEIDRGLAAFRATDAAWADMRAASAHLRTELTTLQHTIESAKAIVDQLTLADTDKIKAAIEDNSKTEQAITSAANTVSICLAAIRQWHLPVIAGLGLLYFIGGAWFVWNDHRAIQKTIYQKVVLQTKNALGRLQPDYIKEHLDTLKAFVNTGVTVSVVRDSDGDTTLFFWGPSRGVLVQASLLKRQLRNQCLTITMRMIAFTVLVIAAIAALWYTSVRSLPYYYDAMIFVLAITCAVLLVDTSSSSRSRRPRRVIRDGEVRNAPVIYDSHQIVCQIGPWKWDIEEFCTHCPSRLADKKP